jgi:hypothetical protein
MFAVLSMVVAFAAVGVTVAQTQLSGRIAERANCLAVLSREFERWTSREFRDHRNRLLAGPGIEPPDTGFLGLPEEFRKSAEEWCDVCDGLGALVLFGVVPEKPLISLIGTQYPQVWYALEPYIRKEREYRLRNPHANVSPFYLPHYEHLVARIVALGGANAPHRIRVEAGILTLPAASPSPLATPGEAPDSPPARTLRAPRELKPLGGML